MEDRQQGASGKPFYNYIFQSKLVIAMVALTFPSLGNYPLPPVKQVLPEGTEKTPRGQGSRLSLAQSLAHKDLFEERVSYWLWGIYYLPSTKKYQLKYVEKMHAKKKDSYKPSYDSSHLSSDSHAFFCFEGHTSPPYFTTTIKTITNISSALGC